MKLTITYQPSAPRSDLGRYRYFFNGQEADNEVYGKGVFQDYGFRMYDTRVAKFWGVDPLTKDYPMLTPFQFASCSPVLLKDVEGLEGEGNTTGYTSDGIPFYYFNARQTTYIPPISLPEVALKTPKLKLGNYYYKPPVGEIRPAKSEYEKTWEFSAGHFANDIRNDRVLQSVSVGIFSAYSFSVGEQAMTSVLPYAMKGGKELYSVGLKVYNNPWGKLSIGAGTGWVAYKQDWAPDIPIPDPIIGLNSQYFQFIFSRLDNIDEKLDLKSKFDTNVYEKVQNKYAKPSHSTSNNERD